MASPTPDRLLRGGRHPCTPKSWRKVMKTLPSRVYSWIRRTVPATAGLLALFALSACGSRIQQPPMLPRPPPSPGPRPSTGSIPTTGSPTRRWPRFICSAESCTTSIGRKDRPRFGLVEHRLVRRTDVDIQAAPGAEVLGWLTTDLIRREGHGRSRQGRQGQRLRRIVRSDHKRGCSRSSDRVFKVATRRTPPSPPCSVSPSS